MGRQFYAYKEEIHGRGREHVPLEDLIDELRAPSPEEEDEDTQADKDKKTYVTTLAPYLQYLPVLEADFIDLYHFKKKKQHDIAEIFGVTQAAVSYRLERAYERLRWLVSVPIISPEDIREDLSPVFTSVDVEILCNMWETSCQTTTAETMGLTQGLVRHHLIVLVGKLKSLAEKNEDFRPYYGYFDALMNRGGLNMKRQVHLPQWHGGKKKGVETAVDRMTDDEVRTIREGYAAKTLSRVEISERYGLDAQQVTQVIGGYVRMRAGGPFGERTSKKGRQPSKRKVR